MTSSKIHISFSNKDAKHLYELALEHFCISKEDGKCFECFNLKKRLERYIGKNEVSSIKKQVRKYSYCKDK